jgi:ribulose-5-phosphate 4-epimerase/fuculose-1-phosphate aldolase
LRIFFLERACKMQVMAQAGGGELIEWDSAMQDKVGGQASMGFTVIGERLAWPALKRKLDRVMPGYAS